MEWEKKAKKFQEKNIGLRNKMFPAPGFLGPHPCQPETSRINHLKKSSGPGHTAKFSPNRKLARRKINSRIALAQSGFRFFSNCIKGDLARRSNAAYEP